MTSSRPPSPRERWIIGAIFVCVGAFIMWLSVTDGASVNGPWWLGFVAGSVFAFAGLAVGTQETAVGRWVGPLSVGCIFLGFAAIGNWIAFGPGPRACTGGASFLFFWTSRSLGSLECRVAFGVGAVMINGALVMGALTAVAKLLGDEGWAGRLKKAGETVFLVTLLPILVPLALFALLTGLGKSGVSRLRERFRA